MEEVTNSKRILKNTILLYIRMIFLMLISIYTTRVILDSLGVDDYGIYNVVGGIVAMFTMISGSLSSAISRFITFELGKKDSKKLKIVFSSSVTIQILLSIILVIIAETIGLWFLNEKMVIPSNRMYAANWVYQFSIVTFAINLISIPYNAAIIAHEKMNAFAYITILEAIFKFILAITISLSPFDRLIFYSCLLAIIAILIRLVYGWYCSHNFEECHYKLIYKKSILKQIFSFAGWNIIGATSAVCRDHGGNIILNLFFGPAVNAARGIATQVNAAIQQFVSNFQMALNPQIIKNYASGNIEYMKILVFQGSRLSFYILLLIALPVYISSEYVLTIWLGNYPNYSISFLRLIIIFSLCESLSGPLLTTMYATGKVRDYQIVVGGLQMLNLPLSYFFLKNDYPPESVFVIAIVISFVCLLARLFMLKRMINFHIKEYITTVLFNVVVVFFFASAIPFLCSYNIRIELGSFLLLSLISVISTIVSELYIGCDKTERKYFFSQINNLIKKITR